MEPMTDTPDELPELGSSPFRAFLVVLLLAIAAWGIVDLVLDGPQAWEGPHALLELTFVVLSLGTTLYLARGWYHTHRSLGDLRATLDRQRAERDAWRDRTRDLLAGLGRAIDQQFGAWGLTPAEKETALLLLEGHSHKQAAHLSGRSERTVRQHAVAVYRKAGLAGRAELSAFFLEDLLLPR